MKQAKITKAEAEQIALAKVSHGIVKSAGIEKEKGHLVWSFDIAQPGIRDITEILSREGINVTATHSASRDVSARMLLTVEINNLDQLNRVLRLIRDVPGVARAARR